MRIRSSSDRYRGEIASARRGSVVSAVMYFPRCEGMLVT